MPKLLKEARNALDAYMEATEYRWTKDGLVDAYGNSKAEKLPVLARQLHLSIEELPGYLNPIYGISAREVVGGESTFNEKTDTTISLRPANIKQVPNAIDKEIFKDIYYASTEDGTIVYCLTRRTGPEFREFAEISSDSRGNPQFANSFDNAGVLGDVTIRWADYVEKWSSDIVTIFNKTNSTAGVDEYIEANMPHVLFFGRAQVSIKCEQTGANGATLVAKSVSLSCDGMAAVTYTMMAEMVIKLGWQSTVFHRLPELPATYANTGDAFNIFDISPYSYINKETNDSELPVIGPDWRSFLNKLPRYAEPVFLAWIWSVFDARNAGRQIMWLKNKGQGGKSTVMRAIHRFLGNRAAAAFKTSSLENRFSVYSIWNKRFLFDPDSQNPLVIRYEKMHNLTGGDPMSVEAKGKQAFTGTPKVRIMIGSNITPQIDRTQLHERSRLIFIEMIDTKASDAVGDLGDDGFCDRLVAQLPDLLHTCKYHYLRLCPTNAKIVLPHEMDDNVDALSTGEIDNFDVFIKEELIFDVPSGYGITPTALQSRYNRWRKLNDLQPSTAMEFSSLKRYLNTTHGVVEGREKRIDGSKGPRVLVGVGCAESMLADDVSTGREMMRALSAEFNEPNRSSLPASIASVASAATVKDESDDITDELLGR